MVSSRKSQSLSTKSKVVLLYVGLSAVAATLAVRHAYYHADTFPTVMCLTVTGTLLLVGIARLAFAPLTRRFYVSLKELWQRYQYKLIEKSVKRVASATPLPSSNEVHVGAEVVRYRESDSRVQTLSLFTGALLVCLSACTSSQSDSRPTAIVQKKPVGPSLADSPAPTNLEETPPTEQSIAVTGFVEGDVTQWLIDCKALPIAEVRQQLLQNGRDISQHLRALPPQGKKDSLLARLGHFNSKCDSLVDLESQLPSLLDEYLLIQALTLTIGNPPDYKRASELLSPIETNEARIELLDCLIYLRDIPEASRIADAVTSKSSKAELAKLRLMLYQLQAASIKEIQQAVATTTKLLDRFRHSSVLEEQYSQMDTLDYRLILVTTWFARAIYDGVISDEESLFSGNGTDEHIASYLDDLDFLLNERESVAESIAALGGSVTLRHRINRMTSHSKFLHETGDLLRILGREKWMNKAEQFLLESASLDKETTILLDTFIDSHGPNGLIERVRDLRDIALRANERGELARAADLINALDSRLNWAKEQGQRLSLHEQHWQTIVSAKIHIEYALMQLQSGSPDIGTIVETLERWADGLHRLRRAEIIAILKPLAWEAYYVAEVIGDLSGNVSKRRDLEVDSAICTAIKEKWAGFQLSGETK